MVKYLDQPKEPTAKRAERRWRNHDVATKFKAAKAEAKAAPAKEPLLIETGKPKNNVLTRNQERFKKEIRKLLDEHKEKNVKIYAALIAHEKRKLLIEKIRRIEARIAEREASIEEREGRSNG
jgi:hypothetical protein